MAFKKIILIFLVIFSGLLHSVEERRYYSLSYLCRRNNYSLRYNIAFGYIDISNQRGSLRLYFNMPYIVSAGNVYYMKENIRFNSSGDVEIPEEYRIRIEKILGGKVESKGEIISVYSNDINIKSTNIRSAETSKVGSGFSMESKAQVQDKFLPVDTIIIDPGHGGKDPGGLGVGGIKEKEIVLSISRMLWQLLKKQNNLKVVLTRSSDRFVTLKERIDIANNLLKNGRVPIFISIHGNISLNKNIEGIEIYSLSDMASDADALSVEVMENAGFSKKDIERTEALYQILNDLLKDGIRRHSEILAGDIASSLKKTTWAEIRGVKKANFYVLKYNNMPAVLVEVGFLSHKAEAKKLLSRDYQLKIAGGIYRALIDFVTTYNKTRGFSK